MYSLHPLHHRAPPPLPYPRPSAALDPTTVSSADIVPMTPDYIRSSCKTTLYPDTAITH
ncbi:hypothetical protein H5410_064616 [Solanum commersonii]|uniref:Uncharacterized protein n=1 Tax=Solanum commersonii TaxID=4109 RepID=A0A9J5VYX2_SOLCO|nr:hypothetical protein H5410_064616 [Solanum commersonii]